MNEKRFLQRRKTSKFENISISFFDPKNSERLRCNVVDLNPFGCKFSTKKTFPPPYEIEGIELQYNNHHLGGYPFGRITSSFQTKDLNSYGIKFHPKGERISSEPDRRQHQRFDVNQRFRPGGFFENESLINDRIAYQIDEVSKSGFSCIISARNNFLFPSKNIIKFTTFFPIQHKPSLVPGRIVNIEKGRDDDSLRVGIKFSDSDNEDFIKSVGTYFLGFTNAAASNNFLIEEFQHKKKIKNLFTYCIMSHADEYERVLELRKEAYTSSDKASDSTTSSEFADDLDKVSHILLAKKGSEVVGSIRITDITVAGTIELQKYVNLPKNILNSHLIEASRACIKSRFQRSDLIHGLFEYVSLLSLQLQADHLITSCEKKYFHLYKYLGFKYTGQSYNFEKLNNTQHHVIMAHSTAVQLAKGMNPIYWFYSYYDAAKYFEKYGLIDLSKIVFWKKIVIFILKKLNRN